MPAKIDDGSGTPTVAQTSLMTVVMVMQLPPSA
jgi:hypothetical protein